MLIDSHCHLADEVFAADIEAVVARARQAGVAGVLCVLDATADEERQRAVALVARWEGVVTGVGIHPHQAGRFAGSTRDVAGMLSRHLDEAPAVVAVGEIGLDYHYDFAPRDVQREVFAAQLEVAGRRDLPVIVHAREADEDVVAIIRESGRRRGVFHCFTGDEALARSALDLGFHVSMAGIVTFPRAEALRAVARLVPDDRLLVETDSPFLAPVPHRGTRNEPARVVHVAEALARVRGTSPEAIAARTTGNFAALFGPPAGAPRVDSPGGLC